MSSSIESNSKTIIIKKKTNLKVKSFRLLDFNVYDERPERENSEGSGNRGVFKDESTFIIQMFGINEEGKTCCLYINDFKPFFYVKVADDWTKREVNGLLGEIKKTIGRFYDESIISAELIEKNKLYGFTAGKKYKFVHFVFKNTNVMNKVKNMWYEYSENGGRKMKSYMYPPNSANQTALELYESSIPPILRYFHIHNISPSGWVYVSIDRAFVPEIKTTTCDYEYVCCASYLKPIANKESRVPYKICSFDIEASSSHGDFPLPKKTYKRLVMNMVDVFLKQLASQEIDQSRAKLLVSKIIMTAFGFDKFDDIDLVYPKNMPTKELVKALIKQLLETPLSAIKETENASDLLTIDSIFEQIKEFHSENAEGTGGDGDDDDDDSPAGYSGDISENTYGYKKKPKQIKTEKKSTIIDVLLSDKYSREEMINIINEVMTKMFPRLEGDKVTFIGSTFMKYGDPEPYMNHCLVLGSCDPVEGAIIESINEERDLLTRWMELIQRENPDIIIGYNIFGFDYEFMFRRSEELHCEREFLKLSKKIGETCAKENKEGILSIENTKIVLASGEYDLRYPKLCGRLQIDMYAYFRRDFNLSSYKLDDVAGEFISDDVKKVVCDVHPVYGPITELYSQNLTGLHINDFIHIEIAGFTSDYYKDGKKFKVLDIIYNKEITEEVKGKEVVSKYNVIIIGEHQNINELTSTKSGMAKIKWGMAKDDVTPQDIFRLANGSASDRAIVAKYCIQDCNLVHHLMNKIDVITGYVEMSRICSVPISFLVFRGQGIKLTSYVAKKCMLKDTLMPDLDKSGGNEGYEGAIVLPPKCSMYMDNPVACVDYSSLYPSSMISQNLSHDSKVWTKEYDLSGRLIREWGEKDSNGNYIYDNLPGYQYIDLEFDSFEWRRNPERPAAKAEKTKTGKKVCRWAQFQDNKKGIMPSILEELLKARSDTRKMAKTEKDPFMQNILDKRQLGYKVTANSLYGQCGAKTSTFYEKDVAACTTATGRMMITYARRIIEEVYGNRQYNTENNGIVLTKAEYVYGDSVAEYTPVYIKYQNKVHIFTIDSLAEHFGLGGWFYCEEPGKQSKEYCEMVPDVETWTDKGWTRLHRVIRHALAPHKKMLRIATRTGCVDVTDDHSLVRADGTEVSPKEVTIGEQLMHKTLIRESEESKILPRNFSGGTRIWGDKWEPKKMIDGAIYANYLTSMGHVPRIYVDSNNKIIIYSSSNIEPEEYTSKIQSISQIDYTGYVYDLTTENHHFAAGIGNMIVHNTDSVFFTFNLQDPVTGEKIRGKKALEITIEIAQDAAKLCSQWLKPPMDLAYEKTLMPFILLSKKRYVGMLYEEDPNKGKMKYMGLSLKRRDSCDYLKDTYGGILNILMKENNLQKSIDYLNSSLTNLIDGNVSMDKLMITKALRGYYKNPNTIAHKVLADRIGQRDPGNKPKPGDRMRFVHIVNGTKKALQGEKIETPEYIIEKKIPIDYAFYITNQLMKPLQQLYGLALEQIWDLQGKSSAINKFKKEMQDLEKEFPDLEIFMKKKEKVCSTKVKVLLFDKFLTKIENAKNGVQEISNFFIRSKK